MDAYTLLKTLHVIGAAVLLGTGAGIAFFMAMAHWTRDPRLIAHTAGVVVIADALFTATAILLQPITGAALALMAGYDLASGWIVASLALYLVAGGLIDIALALALCVRPTARPAAIGMVAVSLAYLAGATVLTPSLWLDPLGALVKVLPAMVLALAVLAILDER